MGWAAAYIIDISVQDHPAAVLGVVLRDFRRIDRFRHVVALGPLSLSPLSPNTFEHFKDNIVKLRASSEYINSSSSSCSSPIGKSRRERRLLIASRSISSREGLTTSSLRGHSVILH
jgi:hypothetical protein